MKVILDYIWLDGKTISDVRHLTKIVDINLPDYGGRQGFVNKFPRVIETKEDLDNIPTVSIDGSSIGLESKDGNDINLIPVKIYGNPLRNDSYYILCEVYDGSIPHSSNNRASLKNLVPSILDKTSFVALIENFTIIRNDGNTFKSDAYSSGEGDSDGIINDLLDCILKMGIFIGSINTIGYNIWEMKTELGSPVHLSDDIIILRHLLYRISKEHDRIVSFSNKHFKTITSEKDEINDPYLSIKKILKSSTE